jgi:hypothetical protein
MRTLENHASLEEMFHVTYKKIQCSHLLIDISIVGKIELPENVSRETLHFHGCLKLSFSVTFYTDEQSFFVISGLFISLDKSYDIIYFISMSYKITTANEP